MKHEKKEREQTPLPDVQREKAQIFPQELIDEDEGANGGERIPTEELVEIKMRNLYAKNVPKQ